MQQLRHCMEHDARLDVSGTRLSSLPPLPNGLQWLNVSLTSLTKLPPLPSGLQWLDASRSSLTKLPPLPSGLQTLNVSRSSLIGLPLLPDGLQRLNIAGTSLTGLPHLPCGLKMLNVSNTSLSRLTHLPSGVQWLDVSRTSLTSLPQLPPGLQTLNASNTQLTSLPESIARLSPEARVTLQNNHLSEHTIQALRDMTNGTDYQGPRIDFDMGASSVPLEPRALHLAVADWLTPAEAEAGEATSADRWLAIGNEEDAAAFSSFLDRLQETKNNLAADFHVQITTWLTQLAQDEGLRAKIFAMAMESTSSCEDRVTLAMNNMKSVQLVHNAEKGEFDSDIPGLVSVGREMFRLEQLELIARDKVKTLRAETYEDDNVDEIEVFLGYQNQLKKSLELSGTTEAMQYFDESKITESDLQTAEIQVKSAENSQFGEWILQWEPLHNVLIRKEAEDWKALINKKIEDYEREYQALYDTELEPAGLGGDLEAERTIGARAMASAEKAFQQGLRPLAEQLLAGHLGPRWSLAESSVYHSLA
ncbi:NEL-type E3 ubiquitin ligase domain-containing protein [Edwardsiella ictaluri]|uniref:NEL-type E3 ubiquitin ligase domain-containing protein n=1 Tax=Edwardsiella ictaluri TaxID=67780 RepID=UPI001E644601|nr:NEL-type E3 ubiquitin ligase domain-containing protein [Edwardsiella ictaluri]